MIINWLAAFAIYLVSHIFTPRPALKLATHYRLIRFPFKVFMRNLRIIVILTAFLIGVSALNVLAQRRPERTRSANATYGYPAGQFKAKKAKKKKKQKKQRKSPKRNEPLFRKKNPWAN